MYRYFPGTEALLMATAMRSADGFLSRLEKRARGYTDPVTALTEGIAFAIESLAGDPQIAVLLGQRRRGSTTTSLSSDTALMFGRQLFHRLDVDWEANGYSEPDLDELALRRSRRWPRLRRPASGAQRPPDPVRTGPQQRPAC